MANDVAAAPRAPIVETASGKMRGSESGGIHSFKGIPYAAPPVGRNRFLPPRPIAPWAGIRDAFAYHGQRMRIARRDGSGVSRSAEHEGRGS